MISRRRMMMTGTRFIPDAPVPVAWSSMETIKDSWDEIIYHCKKGDYKERYKLGDTKVADFGDEGLALMHLVGFDCDELSDGTGKAHISWVSEHCLKTLCQWNSGKYNGGGYLVSKIKSHTDSLLNRLPMCLQNGIMSVNKAGQICNNAYTQIVEAKIWIPAGREIFGNASGCVGESSNPVYTNPPLYPKMTDITPSGDDQNTWLRSANYDMDTHAMWYVKGVMYGYKVSAEYGVLPCFCT